MITRGQTAQTRQPNVERPSALIGIFSIPIKLVKLIKICNSNTSCKAGNTLRFYMSVYRVIRSFLVRTPMNDTHYPFCIFIVLCSNTDSFFKNERIDHKTPNMGTHLRFCSFRTPNTDKKSNNSVFIPFPCTVPNLT